MKKKQDNQPARIVRKSNEEILEAMKQAMLAEKDDRGLTEILIKLLTFTPEKDAVNKAIAEIVALNHKNYHTEKFGF